MRIDVKKLLFIGLKSQKQQFFEEAQQLGLVHFINNYNHKGNGSGRGSKISTCHQGVKRAASR